MSALRILVIEDDQADFLLLQRHLRKHGLDVDCRCVCTFAALLESLEDMGWDLVVSDYNVPPLDFREALHVIKARLPDVPVVLVSGMVGEENAVELFKAGVTDFVLKDNLARLIPSVERALHEAQERRARKAMEQILHEKDELLREVSALAHVGGWELDPISGQASWTKEVAKILELDTFGAEAIADPCLLPGEAGERVRAAVCWATEQGEPFNLELEIKTRRGSSRWIRFMGMPVRGEGGSVVKLHGSLQDITDRKISEMMLFEEKERAQTTLQSIADGVITTDAEGAVNYMNPVAEALTGWNADDALGRPSHEVVRLIDEQNQPLPDPIRHALADGRSQRLATGCLLSRPDGGHSAIEDSAAPIRGRDGEIVGVVLVLQDVTEAREITAKMAYQATHDALTGLPNRHLALDRLAHAIAAAKRDGTHVGVLLLDLDRFKNVNDSLGHAYGDLLLKQIAIRLKAITRSLDTVCRQGGDEFLMVIPGASHRGHFARLAEKIQKAVAAPYVVNDHELSVTFSIGISVFPDDAADADALVKHADTAMYEAKNSGRNAFRFFAPEMNRRAVARLSMESQLRHALLQQEFEVYYQPKVSTSEGILTGAEALIRWNHPTQGLLAPGSFIEIAEESGLIIPIGQWVAREVCRQNQEWLGLGFSCVPISVNLSAVQFRDKTLVDSLRAILAESDLPAELLELELTESFIMHGEEAIEVLNKLKALGVRLSIDDFGTGYSSLSYLKRFPIDTLKIDRAFVRDIAYDENDEIIVGAIISMGHSLRLSVIAEGVETADQLEFLRAHRCNEVQGYYFSKPVPASDFSRMLGRYEVVAPPLRNWRSNKSDM